MTPLIHLVLGLLYFVCIGLDVAIFFVQIRLILLWKNVSWLVPFDNVGRPLVNSLIRAASDLFRTKRPLSQKGMLILVLLALIIPESSDSSIETRLILQGPLCVGNLPATRAI